MIAVLSEVSQKPNAMSIRYLLSAQEGWTQRNVDLSALADRIEGFLRREDFSNIVRNGEPHSSFHRIEAKKTDIARTLSGTRRTVQIDIRGNPNEFTVSWEIFQYRSTAAKITMGGAGGAMLNTRFTNNFRNFLANSVNALSNNSRPSAATVQSQQLNPVIQQASSQQPSNLSPSQASQRQASPQDMTSEGRAARFCMQCGKKIPVQARFCTYCGAGQITV